MSRTEFNRYVRADAWERCKGRCEKCGEKLWPAKFQFDHIVPDGLGGKATLENCQVLCAGSPASCHSEKTHTEDRPMMQKADNIRAKHLGKPKGRGFQKPPPGYNAWTRRIER